MTILDVSRVIGVAGILIDVVITGGSTILAIILAIVETLMGSPEIVVGVLSTARGIAEFVPWLPKSALTDVLILGLVFLLTLQLRRLIDKIGANTKS